MSLINKKSIAVQVKDVPTVTTQRGPHVVKMHAQAIEQVLQYGTVSHIQARHLAYEQTTEDLTARLKRDGVKASDVLKSNETQALLGHTANIVINFCLQGKVDEILEQRQMVQRMERQEQERKRKEEQERRHKEKQEAQRTGLNTEERALLKALLEKERVAKTSEAIVAATDALLEDDAEGNTADDATGDFFKSPTGSKDSIATV